MSQGHHRVEYTNGDIVNNVKILYRTERKRKSGGQDYYYMGECLVCGAESTGTIGNFKARLNGCGSCYRQFSKRYNAGTVIKIQQNNKGWTTTKGATK
jgi:hypothetical protein